MADLNISTATIGYDEAGMSQVYKDIKANLIDEIVELLSTNVPTLVSNVDGYWKGASADNFKAKVQKDTETVQKALNAVGEALQNEIFQMMHNTNNSDATVAESIASTME